MSATVKHMDQHSEERENTISRLKGDIVDRIEEALDDLITKAIRTKESQSLRVSVALKNKKGDWLSEVSAKASINHGKTVREAKEIGGQLTLMGVIFD